MQYHIGCSGWSYDAWLGQFYPRKMESGCFLEYYSRVFNYVEIDSTFYRIPNRKTTARWDAITPEHFRFTAKFPHVVTHDTRLGGGLDALAQFFDAMKPLERKLLCLLIQLPPSLTKDEGLPKLSHLVTLLWKRYSYAIEVRHASWFSDDVYKLLEDNNICLAWSQLDAIQTPPKLTTDFFYLRFIGDRSIDEKDFGRIYKNRESEMEEWEKHVRAGMEKAKFGIVAANNHYAGFGPATANQFRKLLGLNEVIWDGMKQARLG